MSRAGVGPRLWFYPRALSRQGLSVPLVVILCVASSAWGAAAADPCDCLPWKEVYATGQAICGEGFELRDVLNKDPRYLELYVYHGLPLAQEMCRPFQAMESNYCVNVMLDGEQTPKWADEQWCYVSKECRHLNGGVYMTHKATFSEKIEELLFWVGDIFPMYRWPILKFTAAVAEFRTLPRHLGMKFCRSGRDKLLRELPPAELLDMAGKLSAVPDHMFRLAYTWFPSDMWSTIKGAMTTGHHAHLPPRLGHAIALQEPLVISPQQQLRVEKSMDDTGSKDIKLMFNGKAYQISEAARAANSTAKPDLVLTPLK